MSYDITYEKIHQCVREMLLVVLGCWMGIVKDSEWQDVGLCDAL